MALLITLITSMFVFISFMSNIPINNSNPILDYFTAELYFILNNFIVFFIGLIFLELVYILTTKFDKTHSIRRRIKEAAIHTTQIIILSFFLSYIALFFIAGLQLNILSVLINVNPKIVGVESNTKNVVDTLKSNNIAPKIVISDATDNKALSSIAQASTGYNNIYAKVILPSVPSFVVLPMLKQDSTFLLIDNTLIILRVNNNDLQTISPTVAYLFVKGYFGGKIVRSYPKVFIMNNEQYQVFRAQDNIKKIARINEQISKVEDFTASISASIQNDNYQISKNNSIIEKRVDEESDQYKKCTNFYETSYCKSLLSTLNKNSDTNNSDLDGWKKQLELDKSLLAAYKYFDAFYKVQRNTLINSKNVIPYEQGIFEPDDKIKLRLDTSNPHVLGDFLETLTHEYFHYASYSPTKKFASSFFEEGLTEYFARQVINQNLETNINLGYPIQSKIIAQLAKRIAENELIDIYYSKDDKIFETALDRVYGDGFWKKNQPTFDALQYASTPMQLVKLANDIMQKIGGQKFTEKDFFSSTSQL